MWVITVLYGYNCIYNYLIKIWKINFLYNKYCKSYITFYIILIATIFTCASENEKNIYKLRFRYLKNIFFGIFAILNISNLEWILFLEIDQ